MNHKLPDPATILFGEMMYSADQMREYAALCQELAQRSDWEKTAYGYKARMEAAQAALASRQEPIDHGYVAELKCVIEDLKHQVREARASRQEQPVPDEREAFEAWINHYPMRPTGMTEACFNAWQARAALAAPSVLVATVPEGWKLVPIAPTQAMIDAGDAWNIGNIAIKLTYKNMLAAAPSPEGEGK